MHLYENNTCSFVVKIWVEPLDDAAAKPMWRGHVTHVFSGERRYFADLTSLVAFIESYLQRMGIELEKPDLP